MRGRGSSQCLWQCPWEHPATGLTPLEPPLPLGSELWSLKSYQEHLCTLRVRGILKGLQQGGGGWLPQDRGGGAGVS